MIQFNRPLQLGSEQAMLQNAVAEGGHRAVCESWFRERTGALSALMTPSCTHALELAALVADIGPGDEIILPGYTFVSSANAFLLRGAVPVFVDIRSDTCNIDERAIEAAITDRTRAIVPVHYAGIGCDMTAIMRLAERYALLVIEDAAQGVMAQRQGRALGTIGHMGALSFHATKNYTSGGEGGMLLINDEQFVARAAIMQSKGTDRHAFLRGEVDRYTWQDVGSNYLASELQAAYLRAQLAEADIVNRRRRQLWRRYADELAAPCARRGIRLPTVPAECEHNGHLFYLRLPKGMSRREWIAALAGRGVEASGHYTPLHTAPAGRKWSRFHGDAKHTLAACEDLLRLPLHYALTDIDQAHVIQSVIELAESECS